ncbi:uncharacterized protein J3D65DRAFT_599798 [Phyllosticta citribraziliensis]|uniref:CFEM domain-containing protein n=1 Tax=Phyllosticta citribraziliensis TaxID=989973 RepID=A0ABR1M320_9PEZI
MRTFTLVSGLLAAFAAQTYAQKACVSSALSLIPQCGQECLLSAQKDAGCVNVPVSDFRCGCSNSEKVQKNPTITQCVLKACNQDVNQALKVSSGAIELCKCVATAPPDTGAGPTTPASPPGAPPPAETPPPGQQPPPAQPPPAPAPAPAPSEPQPAPPPEASPPTQPPPEQPPPVQPAPQGPPAQAPAPIVPPGCPPPAVTKTVFLPQGPPQVK